MKIAVCLPVIQPFDGTSGFSLQLGRVLSGLGHEVTIAATTSRRQAGEVLPPGLGYACIGASGLSSKFGAVHRIGATLAGGGFQAVFVCAGMPVPHLPEALALLPDETAVAWVLCGDREHVYGPALRAAPWTNAAVALSPRLRDALRARLPAMPVRVLATAVQPATDSEVASRRPHGSPLRLLQVGRLLGRKNVGLLPRVLASLARRGIDATLTVCGRGPDRETFLQGCRDEGVADRVSFLDVPTREGLYAAMRDHHALAWTSREGEGLGLVLLEAQSNACVPVASRLVGVTDFSIADRETGLLADIDDAEDFAARIAELSEAGTWERLGRAGVARTRARFGPEAMARDYAGFLDEVRSGAFPLPVPRSAIVPRRWSWLSRVPFGLRPAADRLDARVRRLLVRRAD